MADIERVTQVRALTKVLGFLPKHWQAPYADGLFGLGVRLHPALASETPDNGAAVDALAPLMYFLPPPAKRPIAQGLVMAGARVHAELATKRLVTQGPAHLGNWRPQHLENIEAREAVEANPEMLDPLIAIVRRTNPTLADVIENGTDEQKAAEAARIRGEYGDKIADIEHRIASAKPEDFE